MEQTGKKFGQLVVSQQSDSSSKTTVSHNKVSMREQKVLVQTLERSLKVQDEIPSSASLRENMYRGDLLKNLNGGIRSA